MHSFNVKLPIWTQYKNYVLILIPHTTLSVVSWLWHKWSINNNRSFHLSSGNSSLATIAIYPLQYLKFNPLCSKMLTRWIIEFRTKWLQRVNAHNNIYFSVYKTYTLSLVSTSNSIVFNLQYKMLHYKFKKLNLVSIRAIVSSCNFMVMSL